MLDNIDELFENISVVREGENIELKKASNNIPISFWETYSSFSNTSGGYIILGVEEADLNNKIIGVKDADKVSTDLWNMLSNNSKVSYNSLENDDIVIREDKEGKKIIFVRVKEAPLNKKPVYINNDLTKAFIRLGDGDRRISDEELQLMIRNANPQIDSLSLEKFTIEDLDMVSVTSFKERVSLRYPDKAYEKLSQEEFLLEIGVIRKDRESGTNKLTRGALLFLGKYNSIKEVYPSFHMDYFNKKGNNERWIDRVATDEPSEYQMNIYNFYNIVKEKLNVIITSEFKLDINNIRTEKRDINEAIRESFINTLAHADYDQRFVSTKIEVYDGFLKFINPGTMLVPKDKFVQGGYSTPRNEIIMKLFRLLGESERQGFGGPQIFRSAERSQYRRPELVTSLERTELTLWYVGLVDSYTDLNKDEKLVLEYLVKSKDARSKREIDKETGLSEYISRKVLENLLSTNKIERVGKSSATKYLAVIGND